MDIDLRCVCYYEGVDPSVLCVQVHIRVASPPLRHPCYMGINIPTKEELIANKLSMDQLANHLGNHHSHHRHIVLRVHS